MAQKQGFGLSAGAAQIHADGHVAHGVARRCVAVGPERPGIEQLALVARRRDEIDLPLLGRVVVQGNGPAQAVLPGRDDVAGKNMLAGSGPAGQQQDQ